MVQEAHNDFYIVKKDINHIFLQYLKNYHSKKLTFLQNGI